MINFQSMKTGVALATIGLIVLLSSTSTLDREAKNDYESLFQRALVTFAMARTLNGVISTLQGTELALQPAGVGVTLTPGEMLDPVNDLVERFSWIMLSATVSLGVQNILLDVSDWWAVRALIGLVSLMLVIALLRRHFKSPMASTLLTRVFLLLVLIRFAAPLAILANEQLYQLFLIERYEESVEVISATGSELSRVGLEEAERTVSPDSEGGDGILDRMGQAMGAFSESMDLQARVEGARRLAAQAIEHLIHLSVLFVLQTGVLPVTFLWIFIKLAGLVMTRPGRFPVSTRETEAREVLS